MKNTIYALDFDGVLCDSVIETAISGYKIAQIVWTDMPKTSISLEMIEQFREVRPFLKTGYESVLILRLLHLGLSVEKLCSRYSAHIQKLIDDDKLDINEIKKLFGKARDRWIEESLEEWIEMNPLFDGVVEFLDTIDKKYCYIVTTKQERFVKYILEAHHIQIDDENIYGLDREMGKVEVLHLIRKRHPHNHIVFIEDRLQALIEVLDDGGVDNISLKLVSWGYNTPLDRERVNGFRIELIDKSKRKNNGSRLG